jgi:parallel beta-helix repeat protein
MQTLTIFRKSLTIGLMLVFMGTCIGPSFAQELMKSPSRTMRGSILYVGGNGPGNYSVIQDAINASASGDTIFVYHGTYHERLSIPKSITLIGENRTTTIIEGNQTSDVVTITAEYVTLRSLSVKHSAEYHAGILLYSDHNTITDTGLYGNEYAISAVCSKENTISGNEMRSNGYGVRLTNASKQNTIANNTILSWGFDFDIYIVDASNDNLISGNILSNDDGIAIYIFDSQGTIIANNTVINSKYGIDIYQANDTRVTGNFIGPNDEDGLGVAKSTDVVISRNIFINDGLFIYDAFGNTVTDNTVNGKPLTYLEGASHKVVEEGAGQIILVTCSDITVQNQDIRSTNNGIEIWGGNNFSIIDNDLINNKRNLFLTQVTSASITGNMLTSNESHIFMQTLNIGASQDIVVSKNSFSTTDPYTYISIGGSRLTFSHNTLDGYDINLYVGNTNESIIADNTFASGEGISLFNCLNNKIHGNTLSTGCIRVEYSMNNEISGNKVMNSPGGYALIFEHSHANTITRNTLQHCNGSITLSSSRFNKIARNNFIDCGSSPAWFSNAFLNRWQRNYWGAAHLGPMIIHGELVIPRQWPFPPIVIPMIDADLLPRQVPVLIP